MVVDLQLEPYMRHLQKEKGKATTISIIMAIAIIVALITTVMNTISTTPVQATTTTTAPATITTSNNTAATAATSSSSGIKLSPQPIYQERSPPGNITPINQTHGIFTFTGNGMLTLPNGTQTVNTTHSGTAIISFTTSSGYGRETIEHKLVRL